jgi:hypothetical protein
MCLQVRDLKTRAGELARAVEDTGAPVDCGGNCEFVISPNEQLFANCDKLVSKSYLWIGLLTVS